MKQILIVTTEFGLEGGGMSLSCTRLVNILSNNNYVEVADSLALPIATASGGKLTGLNKYIRMEYKLKTESQRYKDFDIIIGFGGRFNGYYASLLARQINAKYILCLRGSDINLAKWSIEDTWYLEEAVKNADRIVCLSKEMEHNLSLACRHAKGKSTIIPNELVGEYTRVVFPNLPNSLKLGCAASHLNEKKGILNLLYMINEFKKVSDLPITLSLVGDIDEDLKQEYIQTIELLNLRNNIEFTSKTSREDLLKLMKNWDLYVQGSVCEGHPNAIVEALQNGCAFISSNTGFVSETLSEEFPFLFFKEWTPKSMSLSLLNLISLNDKETIYFRAYKKLQQYCEKEEISKKWNALIDDNTSVIAHKNIEHIIAVGLHDVQGTLHDSITTPISVFAKFVKQVYLAGYGLCSMSDYLGKDMETRKNWIVCTFDDGYKGLIDFAMPILDEYGFTATVFVCTGLIGKNNRWNNKDSHLREHLNMNELKNLNNHGWEIASHGVSHYNLLKLTGEELEIELQQSKDFIINHFGEFSSYAYPYGAFNDYIKSCVARHYQYAFSVNKGGTSLCVDSLQIRRYSISEIYKMTSVEK